MSVPKSWRHLAGRVLPPTQGIVAAPTQSFVAAPTKGAPAGRPRAAEPPAAPPEKDPNKAPPADAAVPMKCAKCEADIPEMQPPAKFCPGCAAPVDGAEPAAPPEGEPAKAMALGRHALALTGTASPDAARGVLAAWKESFATAAAVGAELASANGRLDVLERERVLEHAVAEGKLDPGEAWAFSAGPKGEKVRSFSAWAGPPNTEARTGQSLEQLTAFIAQRSRASGAGPVRSSKPMTPAPAERPASPPPRGINPDIYAAAKRQVAELTGGGES